MWLTLRSHPELITFGACTGCAMELLNMLAFRVRDDVQTFDGGMWLETPGAPYPLFLLDVADSTSHLDMANDAFVPPGEPPVKALQVVYPDKHGRWPWDSKSALKRHPLLGRAPTREELLTPRTELLPMAG